MNQRKIFIQNAKTHNLKSVSIKIPKNKIVAFTGVSGSGKSSLVFDTIQEKTKGSSFQGYSYYLSYQVKRSLEFGKNPEIVVSVFSVASISGNPITAIDFTESILGNPFLVFSIIRTVIFQN